jgi:tetratricopeptide (TPR) repeat protein
MGNQIEKWDVFISHASEDKDGVAIPIYRGLVKEGFVCWIDNTEINLGDSLLSKIQDGIVQSRHSVVILSGAFFQKNKKWTKHELSAIWSLENEHRKIFPILHNISFQELGKSFPFFLDRLHVCTDQGINHVVQKICSAIRIDSIHGNEVNIIYNEAKLHIHAGNYESAQICFEKIIQIYPEHYKSHIFIGMCLKRRDRVVEAITLMDSLIVDFPNQEEAYYNRACYKSLCHYPISDIALDIQKSIKLYPANNNNWLQDPDFADIREELKQELNGGKVGENEPI